ncbi:MAG: Tetracyclin repressor, C-terminal all-alpha domain [Blastococcus sp.]|nr:Tetracyclin repressor, C-terminal all-alpha domain [Blastococcus sp.]
MAPHAERFFDAERFPTAARVGPVAGNDLQAAYAPERSLEFDLERLLDGSASSS